MTHTRSTDLISPIRTFRNYVLIVLLELGSGAGARYALASLLLLPGLCLGQPDEFPRGTTYESSPIMKFTDEEHVLPTIGGGAGGNTPPPHSITAIPSQRNSDFGSATLVQRFLTSPYFPYMLLAMLAYTAFMQPGTMPCPRWNPRGRTPFHTWVRQVSTWVTSTSDNLPNQQQARAIIMAMEGDAQQFASSVSERALDQGAIVNGMPLDPVSYLLYSLTSRFGTPDPVNVMQRGCVIIDFKANSGEGVENILDRFRSARRQTEQVGTEITNIPLLAIILLRALPCDDYSQLL